MPKLFLDMEAIEKRFDRIRKEKIVARMAETERKELGATRRETLRQTGFKERLGITEAGLGKRRGIIEAGLESRFTLGEAGRKSRAEQQFGLESPAMITAEARKTAAEKLSTVEKEKVKESYLEDYSRGARSLIHKLGMGSYAEGEFQIDPKAQRLFHVYNEQAAEDPEGALEALESELQNYDAIKTRSLEIAKMTPEQRMARKEELLEAKRMEEQMLVEKQFPSTIKKPVEVIEPEKRTLRDRFLRRKRIGRGSGMLMDLRQIARQRT